MPVNWGQGGEGAAGGALGGAALGSMIAPGAGTVIGGLAGGALGGLGGLFQDKESEDEKRNKQMLMDYYRQVQGRAPIQLGQQQYGQTSNGVRNQQQTLADQLSALSRGEGPSLAEQQLRSATDRNVSQQASFANSGRGGPMAAARAANNSARLGAGAAQDAASARIAESMKARELLGLNLHGMRGQDEDMSKFNAEQGNQMSQAQMWATLKQQGMTDEAILNILGKQQAQASDVAGRPGLGDQILAGGTGLFSQYATMKAGQKPVG
jgi:hypothetical protein